MQNTEMNLQKNMQYPNDDGRHKSKVEMLRKLFIDKYTKMHPEHPITPKILSYIESQIQEALPQSYISSQYLPYPFMIVTAVQNLNKGGGSSEDAISEYIETNFTGLPWQHRSFLKNGLEQLCSSGEIMITDDQLYKLPVVSPVLEAKHKMESEQDGELSKKIEARKGDQTREQVNVMKNQSLVPGQQFEGSKGENQGGSRRRSKMVERIQGTAKHVKRDSKDDTEELDRAKAEKCHRTPGKHERRKEQTKKRTAFIRKNIEAGNYQIKVNKKEAMILDVTTNHQATTDRLLNSRSEAGKQVKEEVGKLKRRDSTCTNTACTQERNNLRRELAKLRRDIQELLSKMDKEGPSTLTGSPHGQHVSMNETIDQNELQVQEYRTNREIIKRGDEHIEVSKSNVLCHKDKHGDYKAASLSVNVKINMPSPEEEQLEGNLGHRPPEIQRSTYSLVVLLDTEKDKQRQLKDQISRAEQNAECSGFVPMYTSKKLEIPMEFKNGHPELSAHTVMQSDKQTKLKGMKGRGTPPKRKLDADTVVEGISKSSGEQKTQGRGRQKQVLV